MTHDYGELIEAESFVQRRWEPANEETREALLGFAKALGVAPTGSAGKLKVARCLSDLCKAISASRNGQIAWPTGSDEMKGRPYGRDVAVKVRTALERQGHLTLLQKSSKREKLARIYKVDRSFLKPGWEFKQHRDYASIEVRSPKVTKNGRTFGGVSLGRRLFVGKIEPLEEQVFTINAAMAMHPLRGLDGQEFSGCRRIFNDGRLDCGGRLYGDWQSLKEAERLKLTIDGQSVCEIDIKACFLSIAYSKFGQSGPSLAKDPYMAVKFLKECNDPVRQKELREVCKKLVVAYLSKNSDLTQYPKAERKRGEPKAIPFRKRYRLKEGVTYYMDQIKETFPFLSQQKEHGESLMFVESSIMVEAMLELINIDVVAYPIHDCLLVQLQHKTIATEAMSSVMKNHLDYVPAMDVTYLCQGVVVTEELDSVTGFTEGLVEKIDIWDDDLDLIEDI